LSTCGEGRYCGNCDNHVSYEYPNKIFCSVRYGQGKDPITGTLWCCEEWNLASQECYCVGQAKKQLDKFEKDSVAKLHKSKP
jgi:hypothetical protein